MSGERPEHERLGRDLAVLFCGAILYRAAFIILSPRVLDSADAVLYAEAAQKIGALGLFAYDPKIPVLYPALGACFNYVISDIEWACRCVSVLFSSLAVLPAYLLARRLHGRETGLIAGVAVSIWPWLADYAGSVGTESCALFFWLLGAWLFVRAACMGGWAIPGAAAAYFLLHLTRPEGTFLMLAAPLAGLVSWGRDWRPLLKRMGLYLLLAGIMLSLSMAYVRGLSGAATVNYRIGFILREFDFIRFARTAVDTTHNVLPVMLGPVLLLFLGVGLFGRREHGRDVRAESFVLLMAAAQWVVSLFVLSPAPRYLMAPIVVLSFWGCAGIVAVARRAGAVPRWGRILRTLPVLALAGSMVLGAAVTLGAEHLGRRPRQPREYKAAGLWMREHLEPGLVFTRKPQVAFYAGMPSTGPLEMEPMPETLARIQASGARYVVVDERYATAAMRPLLDPANAPANLHPVHVFESYPESRVVVYEVTQTSR